MVNTASLNKFLSKRVCVDTHNNCTFKEPYSELQFLNENPATGRKFTEEEIEEKNKQYENMCKLSNANVSRCCDKNNEFYETINSKLNRDRSDLKVKEIYKKGKHLGYKFCDGASGECPEDFREIDAHDMCKMMSKKNVEEHELNSDPQSLSKLNNKIITHLVPDCPAPCSNEDYVPFLNDPLAVSSDKMDENKLLDALKRDQVEVLVVHFNNKTSREINKTLTEGYPGNTLLHESIAHKAVNCTNFLLNSDNIDLDRKNKDGNTPIHMAALQGNSSLTFRLIKLGSSTDLTNNIGDTVLHSAVRSSDTPTVTVVLSQGSSVMTKNILGETPLHSAIMSPEKNLSVIRVLVNLGSDLLTKNNNDSTLLKSLSLFNNTKENAEIRTFLQNEIYKSNKDNYTEIVKENPELSIVQAVNKDTGEKEDLSDYDNLDEINIQYPDVNVSNTLLYSAKEKLPHKINIKEGFAVNNKKGNSNRKKKKLIEREKVDCVSFIYKVSGIFILLLGILVILKLMKKI